MTEQQVKSLHEKLEKLNLSGGNSMDHSVTEAISLRSAARRF